MTSPSTERLRELRDRLLRLHAALLARERRAWEATHGPVTSGQFLQLLIHDDAFAWLFRDAQRLLRSGEVGAFTPKYQAALQESPDIVMAHADVVKTLPRTGR